MYDVVLKSSHSLSHLVMSFLHFIQFTYYYFEFLIVTLDFVLFFCLDILGFPASDNG